MKAVFLTSIFSFAFLSFFLWDFPAVDENKEYIFGSEDHALTIEYFIPKQSTSPIQIDVSQSPSHGLIENCQLSKSLDKFSCVYKPDLNFSGPDSLTLSLTLEDAQTQHLPFDIFIKPSADEPIARPMQITLSKNKNRTFYVELADDPDTLQKDLQYTIVSAPKFGLVDDNCFLGLNQQSLRSCTYTPDPEFSGKDSIQYIVEDKEGNKSKIETIHLTVQENGRSIAGEAR
ncbi:MAG: hypothetical protein CME62_03075 [Halobacteriovoraceae bacterium]|nr:hypothetical protein [Halobacteriovoraceae bacterium]|tara:strand:- start:5293 stop:5985 length:693 start_codon:yes stop_codon:yes gene_type:complete